MLVQSELMNLNLNPCQTVMLNVKTVNWDPGHVPIGQIIWGQLDFGVNHAFGQREEPLAAK